jgi:hypothetical protein
MENEESKSPNELQVPPDNPLLTMCGNSATALKALILFTVRELNYLTKARVEHGVLFIMYVLFVTSNFSQILNAFRCSL